MNNTALYQHKGLYQPESLYDKGLKHQEDISNDAFKFKGLGFNTGGVGSSLQNVRQGNMDTSVRKVDRNTPSYSDQQMQMFNYIKSLTGGSEQYNTSTDYEEA